MNTLLVDIGNTRVKWALLRGRVLGKSQALAHAGRPAAMSTLFRKLPRPVDRVLAVNVAGPRLEKALRDAAHARDLRVEIVQSTRHAGHVTNGYKEVWRLGTDRWVAAVGAHALARGHVVYALVGTALTVDLVEASGRHRGGAIIPGPDTQVSSLLTGTQGIRRRAQGLRASSRRLFARDTASALAAGSQVAAAAFIDRAVVEATRELGARPELLISGGGAAALRPHLRHPYRLLPDLVLRGLAELARIPSL